MNISMPPASEPSATPGGSFMCGWPVKRRALSRTWAAIVSSSSAGASVAQRQSISSRTASASARFSAQVPGACSSFSRYERIRSITDSCSLMPPSPRLPRRATQ